MYWIHPDHPDAAHVFQQQLLSLIQQHNKHHQPILFVCIGTPSVLGDCLGPLVGSVLESKIPASIYGTLENPVHALNCKDIFQNIKKQHQKTLIIAIDAALGTVAQSGYILLKKGPLFPGKGVGKKLPPIGHLHITGIFHDIYLQTAGKQMANFSRCISQGILELYPSFQSTQQSDFVDVLQITTDRHPAGNSADFNSCRLD